MVAVSRVRTNAVAVRVLSDATETRVFGQIAGMPKRIASILSCLCIALMALAMSCGQKAAPPATPPKLSILDQLLEPEEVKVRVKAAKQELPDDEWQTGPESRPGRYNVSRFRREVGLARDLLTSMEPRLSQLAPLELLESVKTISYGTGETFHGVSYYIYREGNKLLIKELVSRPASELDLLKPFLSDRREVFTGDNGSSLLIGELVGHDLLRKSQ